MDWSASARDAATTLHRLTGRDSHDVAVVLGSGWRDAADRLGLDDARDVRYDQLPGFPAPTAKGQVGVLRSGERDGVRALVFMGRTHLYEGLGVQAVAHQVRTAAAAGCHTVILTNACGSLRKQWGPGTPVLIKDHINLTGATPVAGAGFVDLTDLYSAALRRIARGVHPGIGRGVYVQFRGPQYETPAEVQMARRIGGDLVGMSTAVEAIAAREAGLAVLGISLVTNLAAGIGAEALAHAEVLEVGRRSAAQLGPLVAGVLACLDRRP